jgi:hypothetical protein
MLRNLYVLALLATVACDGKPVQTTLRTPTLVDSADQVLFNGKTTITANGVRRGEISGDTIATFDQLTRFTIIKMQVQFVTPLGRPLARLTAPVGRFSLRTGAITTQRGISVLIESDTARRRMFATNVVYDAAKNQISSDAAFILTAGTRKSTGTGFTADPGLFSVKCKSQCQGSLP